MCIIEDIEERQGAQGDRDRQTELITDRVLRKSNKLRRLIMSEWVCALRTGSQPVD